MPTVKWPCFMYIRDCMSDDVARWGHVLVSVGSFAICLQAQLTKSGFCYPGTEKW